MKLPNIAVQARPLDRKLRADALFVPAILRNRKLDMSNISGLADAAREGIDAIRRRQAELAKAGAIDAQILPADSPVGRIAVVSLGKDRPPALDVIREAAGAAQQWCRRHGVVHAAVAVGPLRAAAGLDAVAAWIEGFLLASFRYTPLRSVRPQDAGKPVGRLTAATPSTATKPIAAICTRTRKLCESVNLARYLGHEPPNVIDPESLAARCRSIAKKEKLRCRVIDDRRMKAMKMGAILAVGAGSSKKPRIIILEHPGSRPKSKPVLLVGKAVTLDTGGYSLKPAAGIPDMKYDKCGGMAVIGALVAAARLKIPRRVVGIVGAAENMISGQAYRPGDIVRSFGGKTIEVLNTDAEGRLVLADCLHYGEKTYKPTAIIDLATLTGACPVALGSACAGLFANDDKLAASLIDSGERTGDRLWRLPLWPIYRKQILGTDGDIKNTGGREAGAITAAMFLKEFVTGKTPWAHLDIAGPAAITKATPTCPVGATGFGVRLLLDYLQRHK